MFTSLEISWSGPGKPASQVGPLSLRIGEELAGLRWLCLRWFCSLPCDLPFCSKLAWVCPHVGSRFLREQVGACKGSWGQHLELAYHHFHHIPVAKGSQRPVQIQTVEKPTSHPDGKSYKVTLKRDTRKYWIGTIFVIDLLRRVLQTNLRWTPTLSAKPVWDFCRCQKG